MNLPPVDALRCFVEAATALNFSLAARVVHLTPAALGQRIKQLEGFVGEPLFIRTRRGATLTVRGAAMLPMAVAALHAVQSSVEPIEQESFSGDLVLGVRYELGISWVVPLLPTLVPRHPRLNLHLYFGSAPDLMLRLRTGEIDCALTSARITDPKLDAIPLHEQRYVFVGSARHLARTPLAKEKDAAAHRLFDIAQDLPLFRYWRDAAGGVDSIHFATVSHFGTTEAVRQLVLRGMGVAVLPEYLVRRDLAAKRLRKIFPAIKPWSDRLRFVFRKNDPRAVVFEWLSGELKRRPLA